MTTQDRERFARTDPFLDELERIGYVAIPKTEYDRLRRLAGEYPTRASA